MARSRHKHVLRPPRRRLTRIGLAASAVLAVGVPAATVVWPDDQPLDASPVAHKSSDRPKTSAVSMRVATPAGTEDLVELVASPEATPDRRAEKSLGPRARPSDKARPVDGLRPSAPVEVTGKTEGEWAEVVVGEKRVWVRKTALAETTARGTRRAETKATSRPRTGSGGSRTVTVTTSTVKAAAPAPQPTAPATTSSAAPTVATTSAPATQPATDATSEPTASTVQEPIPEPTPVAPSTATTDPADTLAADCDVTVSGRAVGLRRQLCPLPQ